MERILKKNASIKEICLNDYDLTQEKARVIHNIKVLNLKNNI
jgi:hypothetical protein